MKSAKLFIALVIVHAQGFMRYTTVIHQYVFLIRLLDPVFHHTS